MAKSAIAVAMSTAPPSASSSSSSSLTSSPVVRFLGHLKQPEQPDRNKDNDAALEFHESDIVWSSSSDASDCPSPSHTSNSPPVTRQFRHLYKSGLFAALTDDKHQLVRRKSPMSPSLSAATAARTIPPVAVMRSSEVTKYHQSVPVNVPVWHRRPPNRHFDEVVEDVTEEEEEEEMVPPHEIVARSYLTFSVFEGAGRTLKGRDLRRVRNAVFQKTGFLD